MCCWVIHTSNCHTSLSITEHTGSSAGGGDSKVAELQLGLKAVHAELDCRVREHTGATSWLKPCDALFGVSGIVPSARHPILHPPLRIQSAHKHQHVVNSISCKKDSAACEQRHTSEPSTNNSDPHCGLFCAATRLTVRAALYKGCKSGSTHLK